MMAMANALARKIMWVTDKLVYRYTSLLQFYISLNDGLTEIWNHHYIRAKSENEHAIFFDQEDIRMYLDTKLIWLLWPKWKHRVKYHGIACNAIYILCASFVCSQTSRHRKIKWFISLNIIYGFLKVTKYFWTCWNSLSY